MSRVILRHWKEEQVQFYYLPCFLQRVSALLICITVVLDYGFVHSSPSNTLTKAVTFHACYLFWDSGGREGERRATMPMLPWLPKRSKISTESIELPLFFTLIAFLLSRFLPLFFFSPFKIPLKYYPRRAEFITDGKVFKFLCSWAGDSFQWNSLCCIKDI